MRSSRGTSSLASRLTTVSLDRVKFALQLTFKGPFVVQSVTSTNAVIKAKDIEDAEEIRQRLSICSDEMKHSTPWIGHGNRLRKRRVIKKRKPVEQQTSACVEQGETSVTRSGRRVNKPIRYRLVTAVKKRGRRL